VPVLFMQAYQNTVSVCGQWTSVSLDVNQGDTNHNRCIQRPVILHTQTY